MVKAIQRASRALMRNIPVPIARGPIRGRRWSLGTRASYLLGKHEEARVRLLVSALNAKDCLWDLGANYGYVTLAASEKCERVISFEPAKRNLWYLNRHIAWNGRQNVTVVPAAVSGFDGQATFDYSSPQSAHLSAQGSETVTVRSLKTALESGDFPPPTVIKMDIEGAEADALASAKEFLASASGLLLFVAAHSASLYTQCAAQLESCGLKVMASNDFDRLASNGWKGDLELLAFSPSRQFDATEAKGFALMN